MDSSADLQIWNNAAFDSGEHFQDFSALESIFENGKGSFDSDSGKENQDIGMENQFLYASRSRNWSATTPFHAVNTNGSVEKSRIRGVSRKDEERNGLLKRGNVKEIRDEAKIDEDIEKVESEIVRLNSRLEALKMEKAERCVKIMEKRGRVVQGKKQCFQINDDQKLFEEIPLTSTRKTVLRRGMSLGPAEILSAGRRGMSMGPSEISQSNRSQHPKREMIITPVQSRRKSCFFKLEEIDEEKVLGKEKAKGLSAVTKVCAKAQVSSRQAGTRIASRYNLKKEDGVLSTIQPKNPFKDGEKSVSAANKKQMLRPARVVASRYNQSASQASAIRKRSLPENDKDSRCEKKRSYNAAESKKLGAESQVKKRWSTEIIVHGSPPPIEAVADLLPRIRIARGMKDSPRDSGPAKRVAELIRRKPIFADEVVEDPSICQALTYEEAKDEDEF